MLPAAPSGRMVPRMTTDHDVALSDFFAGLDSAVTGARRDHEARLAAFFAGLGPVVAAARRAQAVLDRRVAPRFSVFDYFKERETDLSRAFGGLLDPAGTHGQGDVFLRLFLDEIYCSLDDNLHSDFPCSDTQECKVYLEHPANGRKIDIVLKMQDKHWVGIENKPWADEQPDQIKDYMTYLQRRKEGADGGSAWLLYLSGDGSDPKTAEGMLEPEHCLTMPYRTRDGKPPSVENWIRRCGEQCEAERVRWFLKDFLEYVEGNFELADRPGS